VEIEDLSDGEVSTFTLVLPSEANPAAGRISLLAPLGMGMIGYREGDEFEWPLPAGTARYRVRRVLDNAENRIAISTIA
jgi:regulator of nucleoside diphosphate kinase